MTSLSSRSTAAGTTQFHSMRASLLAIAGILIDFFSRTGLFIVGIKLHRMSVAQAMEFYGPVREVLRTKLKDVVAKQSKEAKDAQGKPLSEQENLRGLKSLVVKGKTTR